MSLLRARAPLGRALSAPLMQALRRLRGSYWFVPGVMVLGAIGLSVVTLYADQRYEPESIGELGRWFPAHSGESRAVLSTIAASMIGVAGVTFSMTLVSVSFAAAQYGPRLIGNFMRDRGNQLTLGTFVATFVYALLVLRRVRGDGEELESFVPHLSVLVALAMTLVSIGVLVYFIHHVPETINVSRISAGIGRRLGRQVEDVFPAGVGRPGERTAQAGERFPGSGGDDTDHLEAERAGFVEALDEERLLALAQRHDLVLRVQFRPGDFAAPGDQLLWVHPRARLDDELRSDLTGCFALGSERTADQDVLFLVDQLVEITARALSPGTNDPYTAVACMQWLGSALCTAVERDPPAATRRDDEGRLRLVAQPVTFERLLARAWGRSLQYVARDRIAAFACLEMIAEVAVRAARTGRPARRELALEHARRLTSSGAECLPLAVDREELDRRLRVLERIAADPAATRAKLDDQGWLGGSG